MKIATSVRWLGCFVWLLAACADGDPGASTGDDPADADDPDGDATAPKPDAPGDVTCGDDVCDPREGCSGCADDCGACRSGEAAPAVETDPVGSGDDADDPAIWIDPLDPSASLVIGSDKNDAGGLHVFDLSGRERQFLPVGDTDNVDLREGFALGGQPVALVVAGNRSDNLVAAFRVDPVARRLEPVPIAGWEPDMTLYGTCLYHSARTGKYHVILTSKSGALEQWELFDAGAGTLGATRVRAFDVGGASEGCVADDELGALYVSEEDEGVWRYGAEPGDGTARVAVGSAGDGHLTADVEGLALYRAGNGGGYLIVSSQGDSSYAVYRRDGDNEHVTTFTIGGAGAIDDCDDTDGIEVASAPIGPAFPHGLFVAHDADNDGASASNFKLVPWESIADVTGLAIDPRSPER